MLKIMFLVAAGMMTCSTAFGVEIGSPAPNCNKGRLFKNETQLDIKEYLGKVVLLDFWATWCPPCKKSMPFLNSLQNELKDKGFEVVAISVDEDADEAIRFLKKYPVDYVMAREASGECPEKYAVKAMPSSYFIDRKGIVREIHLGFRSGDETFIRQQIMALLEEAE